MTSCSGALGTGTLYSYAQLEGLWINAGGSKSLAPTMAAIAMAESGGCSTAYNPSGATGLWQILGAVDPSDQGSLTNPTVNAKEAVLKYQSQGLTAWTTYTSGAYKGFMSNRTTPDTSVSGSSSTSTSTQTLSLTAQQAKSCLIVIPNVNPASNIPIINMIPGVGGNTSFCLFSKSEARALIGGLLIGCAAVIMIVGGVVLAAAAFEHTGAAKAVSAVTRVLPV